MWGEYSLGALWRMGPHHFLAVVEQDAVVEDRDEGGFLKLVPVEARRLENDVVGLPFSGLAGRVHEGRELPVNRACLAVGVADVLVGIQDLNLV